MLFNSIAVITRVTDKDHALFTLWTKYGKWESERLLMFEEHAVQHQGGNLQALDGVVVPTLCTMLKLSDKDRQEYQSAVSDILIRDNYLKLLYDICHFAIHCEFLPSNDVDELLARFYNPFLNTGIPSMENGVTLLGHPGIGTRQCLRMCGSSSDPNPMIR
jgi:hypothetical protein